MKYRLVPPSSPSLARLARITRRSSFKGPPDQVRLWIATDFASHAKISKILFPAPKEALYLREMYRAANVNAINSSDPRVIAIMENRLLTGEGNDPIAVAWFAQNNLRTGGNSTPDWIQSNLSEFAKLFSGGQPKDDIAVLSAICSELAAVGNKDCLSAGISLIQGAVPPEHRESMYQSTGAFLLANRLSTIIDEAAADAILDWLESSKPFFTAAVVRSVNPRLSAETKQRAAALLMR